MEKDKFTYDYPRAAITTDAVIFDLREDDNLHILLIQRKNDPFKGQWALPGGFLDMDETLEECVVREVREETGMKNIRFHQLETFSAVDRDPRHRTVTTAYWGFMLESERPTASSDAQNIQWFDLKSLPPLAFDHDKIIKKALKRALEVMAR